MPEITTITSESLQAEVRRLLPSQRGFGQDLEAQNVIVPIVDLTPTAEGSALREDLQVAASFGAISRQQAQNNTKTIVNTPGFYKFNCAFNVATGTSANGGFLQIDNGLSQAIIASVIFNSDTSEEPTSFIHQGTVFLRTGDSLTITSNNNDAIVDCSAWPIADVNGNLINPSGFSFE